MRLPTVLALPCVALSLTAAAMQADAPPAQWSATATRDMQFAIDTIRARHAGYAAGQLDVTAPLEQGARAGLMAAGAARTEADYRRAMVRLFSGFGDPHTGIGIGFTTTGWTGLVLDKLNGEYRVIWSEPNWPHPLPPLDARPQSCDEVWIGTYLGSQVLPFMSASVEYPNTFSDAARRVMFETGLAWTPKNCRFILPDGSSKAYDLPVRAIEDGIGKERLAQVRASYAATARPVGLYPMTAGKYWVGMPDFNGSRSGAAYEKLYPQLASLTKPGWIVFDLRGNGGGDSRWGTRALEALYGKEYGEQLGNTASYKKMMTANQETIDLLQRWVGLPEFAASRDEIKGWLVKLEAAVESGEKLAQVSGIGQQEAAALAGKVRKRPGGPRIAAVIDRTCFSSCMSFLLQLKAMGDTVVLGETTLGYSPYGEITMFELPSGKGKFQIPSAFFSSSQATREPFAPDLPYAGKMSDSEALMKWVDAALSGLKPGQKPAR